MYGKIFVQMYDGTLGTKGPWQALVTFQQLIILADKNGHVDMTPEAISRRTTIPLAVIEAGLKELTQPDPQSRTPSEDGRRIVLLSENRQWGWRIVNYDQYRKIRSEDERREYHKQYMRKRRESTPVNQIVKVSTGGDECQPIAVCSKQLKTLSGKPDESAAQAVEVIEFLNESTKRSYKPVRANISLIAARLKEGATVEDCKAVITDKCGKWGADPTMAEYLRPKTLFNATNFAQYQGELGTRGENWREGMI
jgi:uncharacterized phage protein (TIGR02220 family)